MKKDEDKPVRDVFEEDWQEAKRYWKSIHPILNASYLQYKSILTNHYMYGENFTKAFGLQVYVPRTFQTIESLKAPINSIKTQFVVRGADKKSSDTSKTIQMFDNAEWLRSDAETVKNECRTNALIFGNGYILNEFVWDRKLRHFIKDDIALPEGSGDGTESKEDKAEMKPDPLKLEWEEREITYYKGMKPRNLNPYYVFMDPASTSDEDTRYGYLYTPVPVDTLREYVVSKGWMSEKQAEEKIVESAVEYFDSVRDTVDYFYNMQRDAFNRGDHVQGFSSFQPPQRETKGMTAIIERFEEDYYEVRIAGQTEVLYKDYNVYPHKQIPIITMWDIKVPNERRGLGEPEITRYQQLEENKLHNMLMNATLMSMVPRYAVRKDLLDDESDLFFSNPFKPLVLKPLPGIHVNQAFMPLPLPEVKQSPFELIDMVKNISQQVSGASDFVVSGSNATTETATESNNLVAASNGRLREKARQMDEITIKRLIEQWHPCYYTMYDEDMDMLISGEDVFFRYLPYDRSEANENQTLIDEARTALNAEGDTVEQVYMNAGYDQVVFASDLMGKYTVSVIITDVSVDATRKFNQFMNAVRTMAEVNKIAAETGDPRQFDTFKLAEEAFKNLDFIKNLDEYVKNKQQSGIMSTQQAGLPTGQEEETRSGALASEESGVEVGGPQPAGGII